MISSTTWIWLKDKIYVLSGKPLGDDSGVEKLDNVICTGYVSDSEERALMQ